MAIDFIQVKLENEQVGLLEKHSDLNFINTFSERDGVIGTKRVAKYKGLKFIISHHRVLLTGSLHY